MGAIIFGVSHDRIGGIAMGIVTSFACLVIATGAAELEGVLENGVDLKSEHDVTG